MMSWKYTKIKKKKENDNLQEIFYKGTLNKVNYS